MPQGRRARKAGLGLHRCRGRRPGARAHRLGEARRRSARLLRRLGGDERVRVLDSRMEGPRTHTVVAHARRGGGCPRRRPGAAAQAGAAQRDSRDGH